jgi:hypothetical protein
MDGRTGELVSQPEREGSHSIKTPPSPLHTFLVQNANIFMISCMVFDEFSHKFNIILIGDE